MRRVMIALLLVFGIALWSPMGHAANIWGTTTPGTVDSGDGNVVTVGVRFKSSVAGQITGIRFYKASTNTGAHIGALWSNSGTLLASATFSGETGSGWQQVNFSTAVNISANTTYVAGYYAPVGHYSDNSSYFATSSFVNGNLTALENGSGASNGIYHYGTGLTFPASTYNSTNYWADVVFAAGAAPVITSSTSAPGTVGAAFSYQITATNSPTSYSYTGALPAGLSLNTSTGLISGAPTTAGASGITIKATNSTGAGTASLTITVAAAGSVPVITSSTSTSGTVGSAFSYQITATNSPTSYSYTGALPAGLSLNTSTGLISGTPTTAGTSTVTITATNAAGKGTASLTITVNASSGGTALTSRPNDGSGYWPDFSNTGYKHYSGYTGALTNYSGNVGPTSGCTVNATNGEVFNSTLFIGKIVIASGSGDNLVFNGCVFEGTWPNDNLVQEYCNTHITFNYCTFLPYGIASPPGNTGTESTDTDTSNDTNSNGTPFLSSWQSLAGESSGSQTGSAVVTMEYCDIWGNAGIQLGEGTSASNPAVYNFDYIHDQSDPWGYTWSISGAGGTNYHNDGIGPDSEGGVGHGYMTITHCTIASMGSTNALALQGSTGYSNVVFSGNYVSGWELGISIGTSGSSPDTNCTFTNNIYSGEVPNTSDPVFLGHQGASSNGNGADAPNYIPGSGADAGYVLPPGNGNLWSENQFQTRAGDPPSAISGFANGSYWWPNNNNANSADY